MLFSACKMTLMCLVLIFCEVISQRPAMAGPNENTFTWTSTTPPLNLDPYFNLDREFNIVIAQLVWDGLIYLNPESKKYEPLLATEWRWTDDKTLRFKLRDDVKWHDGSRFSADDVVATINHISNPDNKVVSQQNVNWIQKAEKVDANTVVLRLKAPFPAALEYLASLVPIFPKDFYGSKAQAPLSERFVGTGPYKVAGFVSGNSITLEAASTHFANSAKGAATFAKVVFRGLPDQSTQIAELLKGGVDWTWRLPADQVAQLKSRSNLKVINSPSMRISYLSYNLRDMPGGNPLKDRRVREAIALSLNREDIVKNVIGEGSQVSNTPCYPTQFGCTQDVAKTGHNLAKARALLAEAGHSKGLTLDMVGWRSRDWTEALAAQIGQIGIKVNVLYGQNSFGRQKIQDNAVHLVHGDWGSYSINDTSAILNVFFLGGPDDNTKDPELTSWLSKASSIVDAAERERLYKLAINKIVNDIYWTPLWSHPVSYVFSQSLDFRPFPDENPRFFLTKWKK